MNGHDPKDSYLSGNLLIAMPGMEDPRFSRSVVYLCSHTAEGAMGLVINRLFGAVTFGDLLQQLGIDSQIDTSDMHVHFGGPVESARGFVLRSTDFVREGTMKVSQEVALTGTLDVLRAIAERRGPVHSLFALGYAGWGPGQLDAEIQANGWLHAPASPALVFDPDLNGKWERAMGVMGINPVMLSGEAGHA